MIYQPSILSSFKQFCQLQCLLLQSDESLRIGFEFAEQLLSSGDRMISIEDFYGFVAKNVYLIRQDNNFREPL